MTDRPTYTAGIRDCDVCHKRTATHVHYAGGIFYCSDCAAEHKLAVRIR